VLNNITAGVREPSEWSGGSSDIEGKTTRVGASECGQRTSFNRTREAGHLDEIQRVVANTLSYFEMGRWLHRLVRCSARTTGAAGAAVDSSGSGLLLA